MNPYHLLAELFPFFVLFYILDSVAYVKPFQSLFIRAWGRPWRLKYKGLVLASLLPTDSVFLVSRPPVYFAAEGLFAQKVEFQHDISLFDPDRFEFFPYDKIQDVALDEGTVRINGQVTLKLRSAGIAREVARQIEEMRRVEDRPRIKRAGELLAAAMDTDRIEERLRAHGRVKHTLSVASASFFLLLFVAVPLQLYTPLLGVVPMMWLLGVLGANYLFLATWAIVHRQRLFVGPGGLRQLLAIVLSPVTAAHILAAIDKELLIDFDPAALAARFLPDDELTDVMRRELGRLMLLRREYLGHELVDYWNDRERHLVALIEGRGLSLESVRAPAPRRDPAAEAYCILCDAEYRGDSGRCDECDAALMKYAVD